MLEKYKGSKIEKAGKKSDQLGSLLQNLRELYNEDKKKLGELKKLITDAKTNQAVDDANLLTALKNHESDAKQIEKDLGLDSE